MRQAPLMGKICLVGLVCLSNSGTCRWVAGAFKSVWRCVHQMLLAHPEINPIPGEDIVAKFKNLWGASEE